MSITKEARIAWLNGAKGYDNPYERPILSKWGVWVDEWVRLEDERNDQIASDDAVTVWNRTVKD